MLLQRGSVTISFSLRRIGCQKEEMELLIRAARASYFHPLRADTPLEVLTISLGDHARASLLHEAVVALWNQHQTGDFGVYLAAMTAISPWRDNYLYAKDLPRTSFPVIAVEINSAASLEAAEGFFTLPLTETVVRGKNIKLLLRLDAREYAEDEDTVDARLWSRVAAILETVRREESPFKLALVELELGVLAFGNQEDVLAVVNLLKLALHGTKAARAFKVAFEVSGNASSKSSLEVWGPFFQTVCRVGSVEASESGNELAVIFSGKNELGILLGFWSAVAFSRGYSRLVADQNRVQNDSDANDVVASFTIMALLSQANDVTNVEWRRKDISKSEMDAMVQVKAASMSEYLSCTLQCSKLVQISSGFDLFASGRVIHDDVDSNLLRVLVPGYGIVFADRNDWIDRVGDVAVVEPALFSSSKLTHLHLELDRYEHDSQLHVSRLFSILGASLLILRVDSPSRAALRADGLLAIFESCPKLRQLLANKFQIPADPVVVDASRIVSTSLIKLQLLRLSYPNDRLTVSNVAVAEDFLGTVIPLVGSKLEYLELRRDKGIIPFNDAFEKIVRLCVCLFHFKLECLDVQNLDALIESYRQGTSRVSSLYLLKCPVDSTRVVRFAEFLSDRVCLGSKKLGVLHITHTSSEPEERVQLVGLNATSLKAILAMLEANRSLTELYLGVNDTGVGQIVAEPLRPLKKRFDIYDDEEIPAASERFPIDATLAFVGALQVKNLPLQPEIVSMITTFAAQRVRRSVRYDIINYN